MHRSVAVYGMTRRREGGECRRMIESSCTKANQPVWGLTRHEHESSVRLHRRQAGADNERTVSRVLQLALRTACRLAHSHQALAVQILWPVCQKHSDEVTVITTEEKTRLNARQAMLQHACYYYLWPYYYYQLYSRYRRVSYKYKICYFTMLNMLQIWRNIRSDRFLKQTYHRIFVSTVNNILKLKRCSWLMVYLGSLRDWDDPIYQSRHATVEWTAEWQFQHKTARASWSPPHELIPGASGRRAAACKACAVDRQDYLLCRSHKNLLWLAWAWESAPKDFDDATNQCLMTPLGATSVVRFTKPWRQCVRNASFNPTRLWLAEPDVALVDGIWLVWYFLNTIVTNETFSVIFHLPDYKTINNTMQHQKSH